MGKVKILVSVGGADFSYQGGRTLTVGDEIPEELATRFVNDGIAEEVADDAIKGRKKAAATASDDA